MSKKYKIVVNSGKSENNQTLDAAQGQGDRGQPLRIKAQPGTKYQLQEIGKDKNTAPEYVKVKRVGKNLHIVFEGGNQSDVIIEDYYDVMPEGYNGLVGETHTGNFYEYIPEDPDPKGLIPQLADGGQYVSVALGGAEVVGSGAAVAVLAFNPLLAALGLAGAGAAAVAAQAGTAGATSLVIEPVTADNNRVYFKAAVGTQGTVADALSFRAWDSTTGTDGLTGNTTTNGGTTAFSTTTDTVSDYVVAPVTINVVSADDLVNPKETLLISGKADPNAVVTLNINSQNINVTANATGDWSYDGSKVRYVMVRKTLQNLAETDPNFAANGVMTIGDVTVMSGGTNVAITATQTTSNRASFQYTGGAYYDKSIHDGSVAENSFAEAYGFAVPGGAGGDVWVQLDLGDWYSVDSIDVRARNNLGTRANGTKVYVSTDDMSALSTVQLNAAVNVGAPSTVSGMTNVGSTTYQIVETVATYANSLLAGPNTITASELVQGVSSQATRVVTLDNLAPVTTVTSAALSSDTGTSNTDFITSVAAQTITGNLSANLATGEQVMVSLDNGLTWTVATATVGTSTWSLPGVTLLGTDTLQAKVVDTAGNGSTPYTKVYALVTVSDLTVGITQIDDNAGTPSTVLSGGTTNDTTPQLLGTLGGATQGAALGTNEVVNVYRTPNLAVATVVQAGTLAGDQILSGNALTYYNNGNGNYGATGNVYLPTTPANGDMVVINKASGWGITVYAGSTVVGNLGSPGVNSGGQDNLYFKWDTTKGQWLTGTNALIKVGTAAVTTSGTGQSTWTLTDNTGLGNSDSVLYVAQIENTAGTFGPQSTPGVYDWRYNVDNVAPASITLIGTDDVAPVTGTIAANSVTNDDKPTFSGTTEGNAVVKVYDGVTLLGTTTANGVGAWSFTPTTAMAPGLHSVTATATDAYGNTTAPTTALPFTIDIAAPVAVADVNSGNEDVASLSGTVATNDTSKDGSETYAIVGSATGAKGSLVLNPNGSYTYTRTSAADEITVDLVETFTYKVTDAAGNTTQSTLKITLTPVNDAAIIGGQLSQSLTETNAVQSTSGTLTISDVDSAATFIEQVNTAGTYGKLGLTAAGVWSYTMNSAQNQFVASQVYTDTFNVMATDGTTKQVSVNITGTNDAPVNTLPGTQSTAENTAKYITGLQIADPDVGIGNMTMTLAVTNGVLFLTGSGISFVGNNSASVQVTGSLADLNNLLSDPLAVRFTPTTNFNGTAALTITTSDGSLSDVDTLNILVSSVNYAPVNTVPAAQTVSEDSDVTNLANVAAGQTAKASVSGGGGFDTLGLTGGASLNLSTISNAGAMGLEENSRIEGIERIAMGADTAANTLTLTARDVKDMAGFNLFHTGTLSADGKTWTNVTGTALSATTKFHQLLVDGSSNDSLVFAPDLGFWTNVGTVSNGSLTYTVYQNAGTSTQVLARSVIPVTNNDSVAPVVLDLNRDGQLDYSQTLMDVNNDGQLDQTAWAGRQDGVLVWDKYADGWVHDNSQYAFSQYGGVSSTDLQGLAAAFDSNRDGVLNAQDAKFGEFKVWQDGNGNGVSEVGEVRSLTDVGIEAIELSSDSVVRAPAVGVQEAGRSTAQLSGGGEMLVADAAFAYQSVPELDLAGFVAQTQASAAKAQPLSAQTSVKLFLYDMIQSAHAAEQGSEALFAAEGDTLRAPEPQHLGYHMDLLAEHLLQQPQS